MPNLSKSNIEEIFNVLGVPKDRSDYLPEQQKAKPFCEFIHSERANCSKYMKFRTCNICDKKHKIKQEVDVLKDIELPDFLVQQNDEVLTYYMENTDVTEIWNEWLNEVIKPLIK